ncbi:shikimate kinase [Robertmurraya andreesenii]|uniref:Shikimate kinase n=1 Tax=Anoxybacillus andreesenii TaxID=1325932 RepID=A0ABT9V859_9BACL|nr:shikimate kinase [Robertmurraya andreesenii]MDQ0157148.1 shikimate kinase [Robertmurraya andreesenii]
MQNREIPLREKSVVFIGFMGVGKTTIGSLVAKKLYRDFVDVDVEIEKEYGMPVTEIFKQLGENEFRRREKELITKLCNQRLNIISVGGGAFLQKEIREICLEKCIVFFLDLSWESWKDRIDLIIDSRPVLQNRTIEEIEELFYQRQEIYALHHSRLATDELEIEEAAAYIVDSIKLAWDLYDPR